MNGKSSISKLIICSTRVAIMVTLVTSIYAQDAARENQTRTSVITGRVVGLDGEPLANANVSIFRIGAVAAGDNLKVDSSGSFKTEPLAAGLYRVIASLPGYTSAPLPPGSSGFDRPGDSVTLTLIKGGVLTGTVSDSNDAPVVAVTVRALLVRDRNGKPTRLSSIMRERATDDRGIYRLYGLPPGTYVISAGGSPRSPGLPPSTYETDAPTYAPSSTRDTAVEITVTSGDEVTADIQYRAEQGHSVSGSLIAPTVTSEEGGSYVPLISLLDVRSGASIMSTSASSATNFSFALYGVANGEYELHATQNSPNRDIATSAPKRITVLGADVSGINLTVAPLASIEGRVIVEADAKNACGKRRDSLLLETIVYARRHQPERRAAKSSQGSPNQIEVPLPFENMLGQGLVDARGTFTIKNLHPGKYRIDPRELAAGWYAKSIVLGPTQRNSNVALGGVTLISGQRVAGLIVTIAEGAAAFRGRILPAAGKSFSPGLRVYLVPVERESAENVLRFHETQPESDGNFRLTSIAPGKYLVVARSFEENEYGIAKAIRFDSGFRAKVMTEAPLLKRELSFEPCGLIRDFEFTLPQ